MIPDCTKMFFCTQRMRIRFRRGITFRDSALILFLLLLLCAMKISRYDWTEDENLIFGSINLNENISLGLSVKEQFLINTLGCKIPNFNPFHPTALAYLKNFPKVYCKTSSVENVTTSKIKELFFHPEKLPLEKLLNLPSDFNFTEKKDFSRLHSLEEINLMKIYAASKITCCYKYVQRATHWNGKLLPLFDSTHVLSEECFPIIQLITVIKHDCIVVYCNYMDSEIYKNVHHFVVKRRPISLLPNTGIAVIINKNLQQTGVHNLTNINTTDGYNKNAPEAKSDKLSVIIFVTDSVSRLSFLRKMSKTYKYLTDNLDALEFAGFNKVGDNSFPNLIPVLIGLSQEELGKHHCVPSRAPFIYDNCPWIWKSFQNKGYITAYMEDSDLEGTFNLNHFGFLSPPTDHYGRPYFLASEKLIGNTPLGNANICQGNRYSIQVLHDFSIEFMQAYSFEPTFSFFWTSSMTHDFMNSASLADNPHETYLKTLHETGALNRSVLIFMSDHGFRWGKYRNTDMGTLEERLPFYFMAFPPWFKKKYPSAYLNLEKNTKSLTTHFDIYETLMDILDERYEDESYVRSIVNENSRGFSFFQAIPESRTCADASIHPHYCTCHEMEEIEKDDLVVISGAEYLKRFLNKELGRYEDCSIYTRVSVLRSQKSRWSRKFSYYIFLKLQLDPGAAIFEATIKSDLQFRRRPFEVLGEISRLDSYGNQSHCIDHPIHRKYCICKDML